MSEMRELTGDVEPPHPPQGDTQYLEAITTPAPEGTRGENSVPGTQMGAVALGWELSGNIGGHGRSRRVGGGAEIPLPVVCFFQS